MPFLLPDTPVVTWWPDVAPAVPAQDPLGQLAIRRITDATNGADPLATIKGRLAGYTAGDTDLAWSRVTYWRALLTSALDQAPYEPIESATVSGLKTEPALDILAGWLASRIDGPVTRAVGDLKVELVRASETITLSRPQDGRHRDADPHRQARRAGSVGAQGDPRLPGRGHAPARRRRDLPGRPAGHRQGDTMSETVIEKYADTDALVTAAGDRLVGAITSAIDARGVGLRRPDRRRHRREAAQARRRARRSTSTGRRCTCSGATNATCPPTTTSATTSRPARRCSTTSTSRRPTCTRCPPATASSATTSTPRPLAYEQVLAANAHDGCAHTEIRRAPARHGR